MISMQNVRLRSNTAQEPLFAPTVSTPTRQLSRRLPSVLHPLPAATIWGKMNNFATWCSTSTTNVIDVCWRVFSNLTRLYDSLVAEIRTILSQLWKSTTDTIRYVSNHSLAKNIARLINNPVTRFVFNWSRLPLRFGQSQWLKTQDFFVKTIDDAIGPAARNFLLNYSRPASKAIGNWMRWVKEPFIERTREVLTAYHNLPITSHGQAIHLFKKLRSITETTPPTESVQEFIKPWMLLKKE